MILWGDGLLILRGRITKGEEKKESTIKGKKEPRKE